MGFFDRREVVSLLTVAVLFLAASPSGADDPYLLEDINPGTADSLISNVLVANDLLFFRAYRVGSGTEPWRSDGTGLGTFMIEDMRLGTNSSNAHMFAQLGVQVIFGASSDTVIGLFTTGGAPGDIGVVKEDFVGWLNWIAAAGGEMFVSGSEIGPLGGDKELWKTVGSPISTVRVKDINPGSLASYPEEFVAVGTMLYFTANNGTNGTEVWRSDGTTPGTVMVQDIYPGPISSSPTELTEAGGRLFFQASNGTDGSELWVTVGGVPTMLDICPGSCSGGAGGITGVGSGVCFRSLGEGGTGGELWCSDGTQGGTAKVKEIAPGSTPAYIALITDFDGNLFYFIADDTVHGSELWRSNGTEAGTWMVKDINPTGDGMNNVNSEIVVAGDEIYFSADDGVHGFELWRSDGTEAGTELVYDIDPNGSDGSNPSYLNVVRGRLLFAAWEPVHGGELWALDVDMCLFCDGFESGDTTAWSDWSP